MNAMKIFSFATAAQAWEYWRALKRMSLVGASPIVVDAAHIVAAKARSDFERELAEHLARAHDGAPWAVAS